MGRDDMYCEHFIRRFRPSIASPCSSVGLALREMGVWLDCTHRLANKILARQFKAVAAT
jgi:hypothetical protein